MPADGVQRSVRGCARDRERLLAGFEADTQDVLAGGRRVPNWQAGAIYRPYASEYLGTDILTRAFGGGVAAVTATSPTAPKSPPVGEAADDRAADWDEGGES